MTRQLHLAISPIDSFMFRDGRPFNQGDPGAADAASVFPPFPPTVVGMVRAMLALSLGWSGTGGWDNDLIARLGRGVDWQKAAEGLAPLSFSSPLVLRGDRTLFAAPRSLLVAPTEDGASVARVVPLKPGAARRCDLGTARLTVPDGNADGLDTPERWWLPFQAMTSFLAGRAPGGLDFNAERNLWEREPRVGVGINAVGSSGASNLAARRPIDGALYAATHVRLKPGVSIAVSVSTNHVDSLAGDGWPRLANAGGEHRLAEFMKLDAPPALPAAPAPGKLRVENGKLRYLIYHTAPCLLAPLPRPGETLRGMPGSVVSACLGKRQMIGGWDTINRRPIPMRPAIPAGSVWFMEAEPDATDEIIAKHGKGIGEATNWGFGQFLIGTW